MGYKPLGNISYLPLHCTWSINGSNLSVRIPSRTFLFITFCQGSSSSVTLSCLTKIHWQPCKIGFCMLFIYSVQPYSWVLSKVEINSWLHPEVWEKLLGFHHKYNPKIYCLSYPAGPSSILCTLSWFSRAYFELCTFINQITFLTFSALMKIIIRPLQLLRLT